MWVPTLYFAEALPYVAVVVLSTIMYKNLGLSNTELAFYTSWLYLPWVVKPLWSPFVDAFGAKRHWILITQILLGAGFAGVAFSLQTGWWLQLSLAFFWLLAFNSATHDIAADGFYILALDSHEQAFYVGIRSTFYRIGNICCQGGLVVLAGHLQKSFDVSLAWSLSFYLLAAFMLLLALYHGFFLPRRTMANNSFAPEKLGGGSGTAATSESDDPQHRRPSFVQILRAFQTTLLTFIRKPQVGWALLFMLLFRFPEALLVKIAQPFMLDTFDKGGLNLDTEAVGLIYGTIGVIGLVLGGLLGGFLVSYYGLKKMLWPLVMSISLPDAVYILLSATQTTNMPLIYSCVFIEQFGYGVGFTAYMLYLVYFARGENSTSIYALCTGLMALGMMLPGFLAGWLADQLGYTMFFSFVMLSCIITFLVSIPLKIDAAFGKKSADAAGE
jgi:PAT family beta-lactamase induction signal transducer AmpG